MGDRALSVARGALVLLLGLAGPAAAQEAILRWEPAVRVITRVLAPGDSLIVLEDAFVQPASLLLVVAGDTLRDVVWRRANNAIALPPASEARTVVVRYRVAPLALPPSIQPVIPSDTARIEGGRVEPRQAPSRGNAGAQIGRLSFQGSKTVSLEVGSSQDLSVRQSLDVTLGGEITPGVRVRGVLSDRATPLMAEGTTTALAEVDRVYLEVEGKSAGLTLGDFAIRGPQGVFSAYERQLEGIRLQATRGGGTASVAAATVPGEYRSVEFLATEGKQGPYSLRAPSGYGSARLVSAVILAGSERVWLDGESLVRGDGADYTIDYAAGEITFTGRRTVTKDSRITVDFQTSDQPYRRSAYAAQASAGRGGSGPIVRVSLLAERDDPDRPYGGDLTDLERRLLQAAGDSLTSGLGLGVDCGAEGYGDYESVESDTLGQPFLRYAGPEAGTCRVRFDDVGEGKGDYADTVDTEGRRFFRFVGLRKGRYQPGRNLYAPAEQGIVDAAFSVPGPRGLLFEGEAAGSIADPNVASDRDDRDRRGGALSFALRRAMAPLDIGGRALGRWSADIETRDRDTRFRSLGRIDPSWFGYNWGIAEGRFARGERRRLARLRNEPGGEVAIEGIVETISNRRDLDGRRFAGRVARTGRVRGELDVSRATTEDRASSAGGSGIPVDGTRDFALARVGYVHSFLEGDLRGTMLRNRRAPGTDEGYDAWDVGLARRFAGDRGRIELRRTDRWDRKRDGDSSWRTGDRARTWDLRALYTAPGRLVDGTYTRRDVARPGPGGESRNDLANLVWSWDLIPSRWNHELRADLDTREEQGRVKSLSYVGEGRGRYDSLGVYTGIGDYDLVLEGSGTTSRLRRLDGTWRLDVTPGGNAPAAGGGVAARLWRTSRWVVYTTFAAHDDGSAGEFWRNLPSMLLARKEDATLGLYRIRCEASALARGRWLRPSLRFERERSRSQIYENSRSRRERDIASLTFRSTPRDRVTLEQEAAYERDEERTRLLGSVERAGRSGWRSARARTGASYAPTERWTFRAFASYRHRDRIGADAAFSVVQLVPGAQWTPREGVRVDLQVTRTWVSGPAGTFLGLEKQGWETRATSGLRLVRFLDASASIVNVAPDGAAARTDGRMEVRAYF